MNIIYPNYQESILNVTNSFLKHYGVSTSYPSLPELDEELQTNRYNHIIYILLDGLGMNVINHHLQPEDGILKYVKRPITSVFPPTTVAATNAVLSGVPPIVNGHVGWVQYFLQEQAHAVMFLNHDFYTTTPFTENLKEKYFPFKNIYQQINEAAPHIQTNEFFPSFREGGSASFKEEIDRVLITTHNTDASFNYLYWIEPDLSEHVYGTYHEQTGDVIRALNKDFESLIENITDDTLVVLIADHGLIDVETVPLFEYKDVTQYFINQPSFEPRATTFFVDPTKTMEFETAFNTHFKEDFILYKTQDFLQTNLLGKGTMHPNLAQCFGNYMVVSKSTKMFGLKEGKSYVAHHAGLSSEEMMVPLVLYKK